jgi:hypothetical protein
MKDLVEIHYSARIQKSIRTDFVEKRSEYRTKSMKITIKPNGAARNRNEL